MPQESTRNVKLFPSVIYSDENFHQKEYARLKTLLDKGQREQVVDDLKGHYRKDKDLAYELSYRLGIDLAKELDILHYDNFKDKNASYIVVADYNAQTQEFYVSLDSEVFNQLLDTIDHYTQYQGNTADTLMSGVSGVFGGIDKGLTKAIEMIGGTKIKAAKYIFKAEGISISATYGYGNNDRDMVKTTAGLTFEIGLGIALEKALVISLVGIGVSLSVLHLVIIAGISALVAGILMNTQAGKWVVNEATQAIRQTITSLESKLQSFFSLFKSNPNAYELVSNPNLESKDYQSLIELLLDTNSNAKDIDSLLHSFPHYLQDSKQNLDSTPTQSNTDSTQSTTKAPQQSKESSNATPNNNPNTKPTNTFPFSLSIKDYNTFTPLQNKTIQLTNIDSKQIYTQTTDSRGYVSFEIKESERGDFFSIKLLNDNEYEPTPYYLTKQPQQPNTSTTTIPKHTIQKILNPNSYANHFAILYFKAQISLYFNGTTLCIMQGTKNLASFNARSGKAITQEEKLELEQQGYEGFVYGFSDDELIQALHHSKAQDSIITQNSTLQASCYHCYDKRYQEVGQYIQDGVYYLNISQVEHLKQLIHELESQKIKAYGDTLHSQENQISKEEKESYTQEPHTAQQYNDMHLTLYKDKECREECAMIRVYQAGSADSSTLPTIQIPYNKFKEFIQKQIILNYPTPQTYNIFQVEMANSITSIRILNHNVSVFANIAKPFAPGTYIELEAVGENVKNNIYWQMELRAWKRDKILQKPYIVYESIKQTRDRTKGVHLSSPDEIDSLRQQGYDRFIYIIRASTAQSFVNAAQLVFDLSFEVGVGSDMEVREGEYKGNDTTFAIATLSQAIEYLRMTYLDYKEQENAGQIHSLGQYFSKYPRTAGKIAYIYYRFDVGDEGFIDSIKSDDERYKNDRDKYIQISKNMLLYGYLDSKKSIKIIDEYKRLVREKNVGLNKDFIEKLIKKVCEEFALQPSEIKFSFENKKKYGSYNKETNVITINENNILNFKEMVTTVFHEVRHFYINTYFNPYKYTNLSVLQRYVYWNLQLYIPSFSVESQEAIVYIQYSKAQISEINDILVPKNIYEIQPSEQDSRFTEAEIENVIKD